MKKRACLFKRKTKLIKVYGLENSKEYLLGHAGHG
jgi:hypothetical protein